MAFNNHLSQTHVKVLDKHGVVLIKCSDINEIFLAHLRQNDVLQEEDVNELQEVGLIYLFLLLFYFYFFILLIQLHNGLGEISL